MVTKEELEKRLDALKHEVKDLRGRAEMPPATAPPQEVLDTLLVVRGCLDRIEGILSELVQLRSYFQRNLQAEKDAADEAWDTSNAQARRAAAGRAPDYLGAKERYADANLETLEHRRQVRRAEDLFSLADNAVEVVRISHRGLDGTRQDLVTWLRTLQFESSLER